MIERFGGWFPFALLAILAAVTFWIDRLVQPATGPRPEARNQDPDYIVDGLSAVRMDSEGKVRHTLLADRMTHFPENDTTILLEPKFVTYAEGQGPVTVTSRRARMSGNGENVFFEQQVRVVRAPHANQHELVLETNYLHVVPEENIARTDRPVTIRSPDAVVTASGLELNSETRVLKLHGRVKGTFEKTGPPQNAR
jgi:lipopolysaccharide export system protein LptC